MLKLKLLLVALPLCAATYAQDDKTADYLANPSFEADAPGQLTAVNNNGLRGYTLATPQGWTVGGTSVTQLLITKDCYADNNFGQFGTMADGSQAYYLRMGWSTGTTTLSQTISSLPAGTWELSAQVKTGYANSASSSYTLTAAGTSAGGAFVKGSDGFMTSNAWVTAKVRFVVAQQGSVTVSLAVDWLSGGSCIAIDDFRLTKVSDSTTPGAEPTEQDVSSVTEGVITSAFVGESAMKQGFIDMLAKFTTYLKADFQQAQAPNSVGEACGCFRSNSTMQANEDGVRSNVDLGMICAFLSKYGPGKVTLPDGVTWTDIDDMAMKSLVFAYSTHKANKLKVCSGNAYWGSVSDADHTWESSLWAMGVAYSAYFLWDKLSDTQRGYVKALLKAECNYELERSIPTGYIGDTKAEENGWEACVLAATLGLFPDDDLAPRWFDRLRQFAINSYSHADDATDNTVVDPGYDAKTVADLYVGQSLYDDYTLQNHNYFHTSYQNVVIQELGEAALALKLFQTGLYGKEKWQTNALMHHCLDVQRRVLNWLALADGELAMPNGNDWSLFLYDQITSYTTNATFLRDADALMLENLAFKMIQARQQTTTDGEWLLRSDIGARRMGVEAHRVMMSYLMHDANSTADLTPSQFDDFRARYADSKLFTTQSLVRGYTADRFTTFAWQPGISSYTGYIAANSVDKNKIIVPYKANNTGNFTGWYNVSGKKTNASPVGTGTFQLQSGGAWAMNGELTTNDGALDNRFAVYSTPGNAVIYLDYVTANQDVTVEGERGGLMAISTDEFTRLKRTLYYGDSHTQTDGTTLTTLHTTWVNIDNALGIVAHNDSLMAFGDRANNNSIMTSKLYAAYSNTNRSLKAGEVVGARNMVYYSNITADSTRVMDSRLVSLRPQLPEGWNGVIAADPDGSLYMALANFLSADKATLSGITTTGGAPVFNTVTTINDSRAAATFAVEQNGCVAMPLRFFISGSGVEAVAKGDSLYVRSADGQNATVSVSIATDSKDVTIGGDKVLLYTISGGKLKAEDGVFPTEPADTLTAGYEDISDRLTNPNFETDKTYSDSGTNVTASGVTYAQAYVNSVAAANSKWPNVLPVNGWTAAGSLSGGSNFCRLYSMPYSSQLYCVSPSSVGNYADRVAPMVSDDACGSRTLTVLNSWDKGDNAITQSVTLPAGQYRVLMNVRYVCTNQSSADGRTVTASNGNVNTSLTGVSVGSVSDYRYPSAPGVWQTLAYDVTLPQEQQLTISCGYRASSSCGAANNTLLYVDHVRLLSKTATAINNVAAGGHATRSNTYSIDGRRIPDNSRGLVIRNGKKVVR